MNAILLVFWQVRSTDQTKTPLKACAHWFRITHKPILSKPESYFYKPTCSSTQAIYLPSWPDGARNMCFPFHLTAHKMLAHSRLSCCAKTPRIRVYIGNVPAIRKKAPLICFVQKMLHGEKKSHLYRNVANCYYLLPNCVVEAATSLPRPHD